MQATTRMNRSDIVGGRKLLAAVALAVAVALAGGFQLGHITAPVGQSAPTAKVLTVPPGEGVSGYNESPCVWVDHQKSC